MPAVEAVSIINTSEQEELHLFSISTDSVHFHSSFFKQSVRALAPHFLCEWGHVMAATSVVAYHTDTLRTVPRNR